MKRSILLISLGAAIVASGFGVAAVLSQDVPHTIEGLERSADTFMTVARLYQLAGISGLFGIASFFVGLAYPAGQTSILEYNGSTETRKVVNN